MRGCPSQLRCLLCEMLLHWPVSMEMYNTSWVLKCPWQIAIQQQSWIKAWHGLHILSWVVHNPYGVISVYYLWVIISLRPQQQWAEPEPLRSSAVWCFTMSDNTHVGGWKSCRRATLFTGRRMQRGWGSKSVMFWTKTPQTPRTDPCWQGEDCLWNLTAFVHISSLCLISVSTPLSLLVFVSIHMLFCWSFKATSLSNLVTWGSHHERLRATSLNHQKGSCIAK